MASVLLRSLPGKLVFQAALLHVTLVYSRIAKLSC